MKKLFNNDKVKKHLLKINSNEFYVDDNYDYSATGVITDETFSLMRLLGIPVGVYKSVDKNGDIIYEDDYNDIPINEIKTLYTPINSLEELSKYIEKYRYYDMMVNPNYMNEQQVRNVAYLLSFTNDNEIFNLTTKINMQLELIDNAPLNYDKAMTILKKYFTKDVCNKFINEYKVEPDRFFYLSGLDNYYRNIDNQLNKINQLGFEFRKAKDEKQKDDIEMELKNIISKLKQDALSKFKDESDIKNFLDHLVNFNNYSFNNNLLIWMQDPTAEYVASKKTYNDMGYTVNKNYDDGIKIFIPQFYSIVKITNNDGTISYKPYFALNDEERKIYKDKKDNSIVFYRQKLSGFSLGNVFNASDTNMPLDLINKELNPILNDKNADEIIPCFIKTIYRDGFKVNFKDIEGSAKGYCDHANKEIVVAKGLGSLMQLKVLIHEYGHALAHKHLENNKLEYEKNRNKYETEAESISYVVSKYLGLSTDTYTLSYLYAWSKEKDFQEIDDSLSTIVNYSKKIINNFSNYYNKEFKKEINF